MPDPLTTAVITNKYDIVGDFGLNVTNWVAGYKAHTSYATTANEKTLLAPAAKWVVSKVPAS